MDKKVDSGKCPVMHGAITETGTTVMDWWAKSLYLDSLQERDTKTNPLGVKGVGECGTVASAAVIISAVEDALSPFGVRISRTPLMPSHIVELVQAAET